MAVFDVETNGLLNVLDKVHVLAYSRDGETVVHTHDYDEMREFFLKEEILIGHDINRFDLPAVEKVLGIKIKARIVDTLPLSWVFNFKRSSHGLDSFGKDYGIAKPPIDDWDNLSKEEYAHRCIEDVKINIRLWRDLEAKLNKLYPEEESKYKFTDYLSFKMDCAREQEALQWKLDVDKAQDAYDKMSVLYEEKTELLAEVMPKKITTKKVQKPDSLYKKDGSLSVRGQEWLDLCKEQKQPVTVEFLTVKKSEEKANPNSMTQVKYWLYSLGWKPCTWETKADDKTGGTRKIEKVRYSKDGRDQVKGELCKSVLKLVAVDETVKVLDGQTVLKHRLGILKSFLDPKNNIDGWLCAKINGFTNTLRFKHISPLVNLPSVEKPYGDVIRGCLTCPDGYTLCGADMTSLEDTTKRHFMYPLDPDYVKEMSKEGFDPHLDLAKHKGVITQEDIDKHNRKELDLSALRKDYKVVNYSATYGITSAGLSRDTGMPSKDAKKLLDSFWSRNWSIHEVASKLRTRDLFGSTWLYNPVSGFWHSLRSDKDRFSTLNQSTGVFCFDSWLKLCRDKGVKTIGQFHDETIAILRKGEEEQIGNKMDKSIEELNDELGLNVPLGIDKKFGNTYAEIKG